ncbi:MAG: hypothetical protein JST16_04475 [Bdellovibrionales bacterium]|nr:hypothetical protein [Bdellovibrionales bacterium]
MIKQAGKSLKSRNQPQVMTFLSANIIALVAAFVGLEALQAFIGAIRAGEWSHVLKIPVLIAVGAIATRTISWAIPREWKETLVFWRRGMRSLPSSEAFTVIAPSDLRIDILSLQKRFGPLPTEYQKQSSLWYAIYRKHCKDLVVEDANSAYLLFRELTAIMPVLMIGCLVGALPLELSLSNSMLAALALGFEYLVVMYAARNAGKRLVANVLALEASSEIPKPQQAPAPAKRARKTAVSELEVQEPVTVETIRSRSAGQS